jgi:hypothetical protein
MTEKSFPPAKEAYGGRRRAAYVRERLSSESGETVSDLLPTRDEKDALAGTSGTPSKANKYVTHSDPRLSDQRDAKSLQGVAVATTAPADQEVLTYDAALQKWKPAAGGGGGGGPHDIDGSFHTRSGRVTAGTGLQVNIEAVRVRINDVVTDLTAGSLTLTDNATNYVFIDRTPAVAFTTSGFPPDCIPLAEVVTAAGGISSITDKRAFLWEITGEPQYEDARYFETFYDDLWNGFGPHWSNSVSGSAVGEGGRSQVRFWPTNSVNARAWASVAGSARWPGNKKGEFWAGLYINDVVTFRRQFVGMVSAVPAADGFPTDGVYFYLANAGSATTWKAVCRAGGSETVVDTGVMSAVWAFWHFRIVRKASSVEFYINGSLKATITATLPTANLFPIVFTESDTTDFQELVLDYLKFAWER